MTDYVRTTQDTIEVPYIGNAWGMVRVTQDVVEVVYQGNSWNMVRVTQDVVEVVYQPYVVIPTVASVHTFPIGSGPAAYQIVLYDPMGRQIGPSLDRHFSCEYTRKVNDVGAMTLSLPDDYDLSLFKPDTRLAIMRKIDRWYLEGQTIWFVRKITHNLQGKSIEAEDANGLLKRRIVAYDAGSAQGYKAMECDDMMKQIVDDNMGVAATDATRNLSAYLTIQPDLSQCGVIEKEIARRTVLDVLQEIAKTSWQYNGVFLAFDVVCNNVTQMQFQTFTGQRGRDHRFPGGSPPLIFAPEYRNLGDPELVYDYSEEYSYVYAGGQDTEAARDIQVAYTLARIGRSPFSRIEHWHDARQIVKGALTALRDEAETSLLEGVPRRTFTGKALEIPGCRYGLHYFFGDRVTGQYGEDVFDCRVDVVHNTISNGKEDLDIVLKADDYTPVAPP